MKYQFLPFILCFIINWNTSFAQIYVDSSAVNGGNGMSWVDAFNDLQDALSMAQENDTIYIAEGTYSPDSINGDPASTFLINTNLILLGGFNADNGEQNPVIYETILSGDLNGDDLDDDFAMNREDNVMTVLTLTDTVNNETIIDGVTISHGHADGNSSMTPNKNGGAIYSDGTPTIRRCTFKQNYAEENGGAILQVDPSNSMIILDSCLFHSNLANEGAAAHIVETPFHINDCTFHSNVNQEGAQVSGGTLFIEDPFSGTVNGSVFEGNEAADVAPGIVILRWAPADPGGVTVEILNCSFINNFTTVDSEVSAGGSGALAIFTHGTNSNFLVKGSTFENNICTSSGGGIALTVFNSSINNSILIDSCLFSNNEARYNGCGIYTRMTGQNINLEINRCQFLENESIATANPLTSDSGVIDLFGTSGATGTATVDSCYFEGNSANDSGAIELGNKHGGGAFMDYFITNSIFKSNEALTGGAIGVKCNQNSTNDVLIENCEFTDNKATIRGGAIRINHDCNANTRIERCTFQNNESPIGAAIDNQLRAGGSGETLVENSLFKHNISDNSIILLDSMAHLKLLNCTISDNSSDAIVVANQSTLVLQNTILSNPGFTEFSDATSDNTFTSNGGNLILDNSIDVLLLDPSDQTNTSPDIDNEFKPMEGGNLVNAGINSGVTSAYDLAMNPRIQQSIVDIGAYESPFVTKAKEVIVGKIKLTPNPVIDFLNIQLTETIFGPVDISLFDSQGKLVKKQTIFDGQSIQVAELSVGLYFLKLTNRDRIYIGKFVKQ